MVRCRRGGVGEGDASVLIDVFLDGCPNGLERDPSVVRVEGTVSVCCENTVVLGKRGCPVQVF